MQLCAGWQFVDVRCTASERCRHNNQIGFGHRDVNEATDRADFQFTDGLFLFDIVNTHILVASSGASGVVFGIRAESPIKGFDRQSRDFTDLRSGREIPDFTSILFRGVRSHSNEWAWNDRENNVLGRCVSTAEPDGDLDANRLFLRFEDHGSGRSIDFDSPEVGGKLVWRFLQGLEFNRRIALTHGRVAPMLRHANDIPQSDPCAGILGSGIGRCIRNTSGWLSSDDSLIESRPRICGGGRSGARRSSRHCRRRTWIRRDRRRSSIRSKSAGGRCRGTAHDEHDNPANDDDGTDDPTDDESGIPFTLRLPLASLRSTTSSATSGDRDIIATVLAGNRIPGHIVPDFVPLAATQTFYGNWHASPHHKYD